MRLNLTTPFNYRLNAEKRVMTTANVQYHIEYFGRVEEMKQSRILRYYCIRIIYAFCHV